MIPRTVQMAKAVSASAINTAVLGNIIAPFHKGWTNNSVNYFTRIPAGSAPHTYEPGNSFVGQPCVYSYKSDGTPIYRWFPVKVSNFSVLGSNSRAITPCLYSGTLSEPPIDHL